MNLSEIFLFFHIIISFIFVINTYGFELDLQVELEIDPNDADGEDSDGFLIVDTHHYDDSENKTPIKPIPKSPISPDSDSDEQTSNLISNLSIRQIDSRFQQTLIKNDDDDDEDSPASPLLPIEDLSSSIVHISAPLATLDSSPSLSDNSEQIVNEELESSSEIMKPFISLRRKTPSPLLPLTSSDLHSPPPKNFYENSPSSQSLNPSFYYSRSRYNFSPPLSPSPSHSTSSSSFEKKKKAKENKEEENENCCSFFLNCLNIF